MGTVRTTLLAKICAMTVLAAAGQGVDNRISAFALSLPIDEYYVQGCSIMDISSDRVSDKAIVAIKEEIADELTRLAISCAAP